MWLLFKMQRIQWIQIICNIEVLRRADIDRKLMRTLIDHKTDQIC